MLGKKLLVADDSLTIQKVIRLALSNEGYEIQAVSDGNDAIQQIALFRPDVVLIDVSLPGKSAFEVKREINSHGDLEEVRFVLMSSAFEKVDEVQSNEVLFHGRLTKPFDPAHLRQVLTDVLAQVAAKRTEKTSLLQHPASEPSLPPMPPSFPKTAPPPPPTPQGTNPGFEPSAEISLATISKPIEIDEWSQSLKPDELPPLPTRQPENIGELWENEPGSMELMESTSSMITIAPPPPSEFPTEEHSSDEQSDEIDIKHLTESTMRITGMDDYQWSVSEPSLRPSPGMTDDGGSQFEVSPPEIQTEMEEAIEQAQSHVTNAAFEAPPSPSLSDDQIEVIVRDQVQIILEKMAQKLLPEVAERIIKQEIHRMLSE